MYLFGGKFCMWADRSRPCTCAEVVSRHPMCRCDRKHFNDIVWALVTVFQVPLFPPSYARKHCIRAKYPRAQGILPPSASVYLCYAMFMSTSISISVYIYSLYLSMPTVCTPVPPPISISVPISVLYISVPLVLYISYTRVRVT